jgi:ferritin-like metal-binding protein YciE
VCESILREEEAMAHWLDEHLPSITRKYLARAEQKLTAKH